MEQPTLPKLTAKILESEEYSAKQRSRKPVKKKDIGWPTDFRHSSHIGFMDNNSVDGIVPIEVDGKLVYVDSNTMEKIQDANLSSPILEGKEWAIDAPDSISPQRRPPPKRIPVLAETTEKVFSQPVSSVDTPNIPSSQPLYENIPISTKRTKAPAPPPPPPKTKKPALKPLPVEAEVEEDPFENFSIKSINSEKVAQIEEKIDELTEELEKLRKEKAKLLTEVEVNEEKRKVIIKDETEYEPFVQARVIDRFSSTSTDLSPTRESSDNLSHTGPEDELHSPQWEEGIPEVIEKYSKPKKDAEIVKIHSLSKDQELEKEEIEKIKQFTESIMGTSGKKEKIEKTEKAEKIEKVKSVETPQPFKPVPPPRRKQPQIPVSPSPSNERALRKSQDDLEESSDNEFCRL
jgi:hypothetical protein